MTATATPIIHLQIAGVPALKQRLAAAVDKPMVLDAAGRGVSNLVIRHLRARNNRPGKAGWPKSNYWEDAASSTQTKTGNASAVITIHAPGIKLHLHGGEVRSKSGGSLALPARPEVAGIWPSEYAGRDRIFLLVRKAFGKAYLAEKEEGGHIRILWRLVKKTRHVKDSTVLPGESALIDAATAAVNSILPQAK